MIKKILSILCALTLVFGMTGAVQAAELNNESVTTESNSNFIISPQAVSVSASFSCSVGESWQKTFDTKKFFAEDHNAFKTVITEVSGKYKVIITGSDGYAYESKEYNGVGVTLTTTNAASSVDYTVTIQVRQK